MLVCQSFRRRSLPKFGRYASLDGVNTSDPGPHLNDRLYSTGLKWSRVLPEDRRC